ncbi:hypothetical protein D3C73_771730 [compost metagenome]
MRGLGRAGRQLQWNGEGKDNTGERRVDTRGEDQHPEHSAKRKIGPENLDAHAVEDDQIADHNGCSRKREQIEFSRIEKGNDDDRAEVINDGKCRQEDLEGCGNTIAEKRHDPEREGDVRCGRDRPAAKCTRIAPVEPHIKQCRKQHTTDRRRTRENATAPARKLSVEHFAFDFQADQQEEDAHQCVVDPVLKAQRSDIDMEEPKIDFRQRRICRHDGS